MIAQRPFQKGFLWSSLSLALFGGFAIGAHVAYVAGFGHPLKEGYLAFIQAHGHLQLMGFAGLLIMGVALYFIPRLTGVPFQSGRPASLVLWLITLSLWSRGFFQSLTPYLPPGPLFQLLNGSLAAAGTLEFLGTLIFGFLLFSCLRARGPTKSGADVFTVKPFFLMMIAGFLFFTGLNCILWIGAVKRGLTLLPVRWDHFALQLFLHLTLLPVTFAFSLKTLPLFLRLPAITWRAQRFAYGYLACVILQLVPAAPFFRWLGTAETISGLGEAAKGLLILYFIFKLDILTRFRKPWTEARLLTPESDRKPTRPGLPDYGEYGRFEWHIYAAYVWLVLAAAADTGTGIALIFRAPVLIPFDAIRHAYFAGFITHLIFGMAPRMLPGFMGAAGVAHPRLVELSFYLAAPAAAFRVIPLMMPGAAAAQIAFGLSGILAMAAVAVLWVNLGRTARRAVR